MIKWLKPSGLEIETNETQASIAFAEASGWLRADKPKRKRRTKSEIEADNNGDSCTGSES